MHSQERFTLIDGLRGIAALMVVIFHLHLTVEQVYADKLPAFVNYIFKLGHWGIEIFFVISGFVIAYSVRNGSWTFPYLARFGLRRSIRLDPPYWIIIAIEVSLIYISLYFFPDLGTELPNLKKLAAHLVYLQQLLGLGHLLPIFWTLCYEVQFYLVLVTALVLYNHLKNRHWLNTRTVNIIFSILVACSYLYSLGIFLKVLPTSISGLFIDRWYQFLLGALAWWCASNRGPRQVFLFCWLLTLLSLFFANDPDFYRSQSTLVILFTSMLVYQAFISDKITRWLKNPVILFLGTISYSLYLVHLPIGWRLIAFEKKLIGEDMNLLSASLALISGIAISILAAWILYRVAEKPSLNFAHRIHLPKTSAP